MKLKLKPSKLCTIHDVKLLETPVSKYLTQMCSHRLLVRILLLIDPKNINVKKLFKLIL